MQTMEIGPAEAALTQMSAIPPSASSSYFLQLDPSGQVDILDSSVVLNKPDMADETVYEIQLDPFMMDERNVEIINLPNLQNTGAFQQEFVEEHQFGTTFYPQVNSYEPQVQFTQLDEFSLNQFLINAAGAAVPIATELNPPVFDESATVPDFTVETEVAAGLETEQVQTIVMSGVPGQPFEQQIVYVQGAPGSSEIQLHQSVPSVCVTESSVESALEPNVESLHESSMDVDQNVNDTITKDDEDLEISLAKESSPVRKSVKRNLPDVVMPFTDEPVLPPIVEILPSTVESDAAGVSSVVTLNDEDGDASEDDGSDEIPENLQDYLHEGIDADDELYISFLKRPSRSKKGMCILCYKWLDTMEDLQQHLKDEHENNMKLYGCKKCGKRFWARFLRQRHEKLHRYDLKGPIERYMPKNRPFDHYETKHYLKRLRRAPLTEKFRDHIRLIHSEVKSTEFDCIQCEQVFQTEEDMREHYEEEHALQTCIHCDKTLDNSKALRKHEKEIHGIVNINKNYPGGAWKLWENWDCDEMKEKEDKLVNVCLFHNYHKRIKMDPSVGEDAMSNSCDKYSNYGCEEVTVTELEVPKSVDNTPSVEKQEKRNGKQSKTSSPQKGAETPKSKRSEQKQVSTKVKDFEQIEFEDAKMDDLKRNDLPFKCDSCRTSFDNEIDLQRHNKSHSVRTMAYMCQYCGRGFATHSNRKEHERIHTGDKPYVCPICNRAFVQISNLKKHIQTHKDKNNLQCTTCNKQFVKESSLILHQRAHSQDRKFRCHICDRAYNYASLLKRHMRIHTGENPYSCEDCGMQFHELVSLHYHRKKVHTGERPHRCEQCGRAFILSSDLKKHLKIHLRDSHSIKSSGNSPSVKPKTIVNGATIDSVDNGPEMDDAAELDDDEDEEDLNASLLGLHAEESGDLPEESDTDRILVISENDLLNATAGSEEKMDVSPQKVLLNEQIADAKEFSSVNATTK